MKKIISSKNRISPLALALSLSGCMAAPTNPDGKTDGANGGHADGGGVQGGEDLSASIPHGGDEFGLESFLGQPITGCSDGTGFSAGTLTLAMINGAADASVPILLNAPGGNIAVNGLACVGTVSSVAGTALTTTNVTKIVVTGTAFIDKVVIDLLPGTLGTKIFGTGATAGITLNLNDLADVVMVRGTTGVDTFKVVNTAAGVTGVGDIYLELSGDKNADIKISNGGVATGSTTVAFALGDGADVITGQPALAADVATFGGASITTLPMSAKMTVYGGSGNDIITGGTEDDSLHGGDGDDTFRMAATDDGGDTYYGDAGVDFVDYSNRTAAVTVDIGNSRQSTVGTVDLSTLAAANWGASGTLDGKTLKVKVDGGSEITITLDDASSPANIVSQINTRLADTGGTPAGNANWATTAYLTGKNYIGLQGYSTSIEVTGGNSNTILGLGATVAVITSLADADDGLGSEADDVRSGVENITGGSAADVLFGDAARNVLKGGGGADTLFGGANATFASAAVADLLQGEAGADLFYVPVANYFAVIEGGADADEVHFSARGAALTLSNEGTANDGETSESINVKADVEKMVGGFSGDTLTGGANADILIGGPGADTLLGLAGADTIDGGLGADLINGGDGTDIMDYSARTATVTVTLCMCANKTTAPSLTPSTGDCPSGNDDGESSETDTVANMEWVKGGDGADSISAAGVTVSVILEGGAAGDTLTGGSAGDMLWGDGGADTLNGGAGDDSLEGGLGADIFDGGSGDGDVCIGEVTDTVAQVGCELG